MIKFTCTECRHVFDAHTTYCQDRLDPNKSLGCPECHTFFRKRFCIAAFLFQALSLLGWAFLVTGFADLWLARDREVGYLKMTVGLIALAIWGILYAMGKQPKNARVIQLTKVEDA